MSQLTCLKNSKNEHIRNYNLIFGIGVFMKHFCIALMVLFSLGTMSSAQGTTTTEATKANDDLDADFCETEGTMVQDIVERKMNGEALESVLEAIVADPAYQTVRNRYPLPPAVEAVFKYMGGMDPEDAKTNSVKQCMIGN